MGVDLCTLATHAMPEPATLEQVEGHAVAPTPDDPVSRKAKIKSQRKKAQAATEARKEGSATQCGDFATHLMRARVVRNARQAELERATLQRAALESEQAALESEQSSSQEADYLVRKAAVQAAVTAA